MPVPPTKYDFFVSYARRDNAGGWITKFIEALQAEHRAFTGGRTFNVFLDTSDITSLDDWRHRLYESLAASHLLVAFLSPNYFASEWCRREWRTWIDHEIAKHMLSDGAASLYIVEVPWMEREMTEQEVWAEIAGLSSPPANPPDRTVRDAMKLAFQIHGRRQLTKVQPFFAAGLDSLRREDLRRVLAGLAKDLDERAARVVAAEASPNTIPDYNKRFCGRLDELNKLRELLDDDRAGVITSVHGLGGVGKTELAFTYAHAFASLYPGGRYLIPCDTFDSLRQAALVLDEIFRSQIPDQARETLDAHFTAVRDCLRNLTKEKGRVLLVLDNVAKREFLSPQATDHFAGFGGRLHLLATTRLGPQAGKGKAGRIEWLTLDSLPEADALDMMEKHRDFVSETERESARRIVRRLGGFTLAVELVAAYLAQHTDVSCAAFLERLGLEDLEALEDLGADQSIELRRKNDEHRLSAVLAPTLTSLSACERCVMEFAALLPPDDVVLPWLRELAGKEHPEAATPQVQGHPEPWHQIEQRLLSLALLSRSKDEEGDSRVVRCHRLVGAVIRAENDGLAKTRDQQLFHYVHCESIRLANATEWGRSDSTWQLRSIACFAQALLNREDKRGLALAVECARPLVEHWDVCTAEQILRDALACCEYHPAFASAKGSLLNTLGDVLRERKQLDESEKLIRQAILLERGASSPNPLNLSSYLNNLGLLQQSRGLVSEAESALNEALLYLENGERTEVKREEERAIIINNLADLMMTTGKNGDAERLMLQSKDILTKCFGRQHPDVANVTHNLAVLHQRAGRFAKAVADYESASTIYEAAFGAVHLRTGSTLADLAYALALNGQYARATKCMTRAISILSPIPDLQRFGVRPLDNLVTDLVLMLIQEGRNRDEVKVSTAGMRHGEPLGAWTWWKLRIYATMLSATARIRRIRASFYERLREFRNVP